MRNASGGYLSCPGKKDTKEAGLREALRNCSRKSYLSKMDQQNDTERRRAITIIAAPSTARPPLRISPARFI